MKEQKEMIDKLPQQDRIEFFTKLNCIISTRPKMFILGIIVWTLLLVLNYVMFGFGSITFLLLGDVNAFLLCILTRKIFAFVIALVLLFLCFKGLMDLRRYRLNIENLYKQFGRNK